MTALALAVGLCACASLSQRLDGDAGFAKGKAIALIPSQADPLDHDLDVQAAAKVMARFAAAPARISDPQAADYLIEVAVGRLPAKLGVLHSPDSAKPDWLAPPRSAGLLPDKGPVAYSLTIAAIDAHTGQAVFRATATSSKGGKADAMLDRLVTAALTPEGAKAGR